MTLLAVMQSNDFLSDYSEMRGPSCVAGLRLVCAAMIKRCDFCGGNPWQEETLL